MSMFEIKVGTLKTKRTNIFKSQRQTIEVQTALKKNQMCLMTHNISRIV